jgi:hypothetical protein
MEADPAGGDLAPRFGAHRSPGLAEWAADSRTGNHHVQQGQPSMGFGAAPAISRWQPQTGIGRYTQHLAGIGADVVFGASPEQMPAAVSLLITDGALAGPAAQQLGQATPPAGRNAPAASASSGTQEPDGAPDVLLDLGRLDFSSTVLGLAPQARLLLVAGGWPDSVAALVSRRDMLRHKLRTLAGSDSEQDADPRIGVLLVGDLPYTRGEIQIVVGLPVVGVLPYDRRGADVLSGRRDPGRAWTRTPLLRACTSLAATLHADLHLDRPAGGHSGLDRDDGRRWDGRGA